MSRTRTKKIDNALATVDRAIKSKQPRFQKAVDPDTFFASVMDWYASPEFQEVAYGSADTRTRDKWLSSIWMKEPHLAGVLNGASLIDANRGWTLTGGRNQVNRYLDMMHNLEGGKGYNTFQRKMAVGFRTCDIGAIAEIGRDGKNGPMRMLWSVDPTRCRVTGKQPFSLKYSPNKGKEQEWTDADYFRLVSMPSIREEMYDVGFCGVSRAIELTKIAIGLEKYDQEKLRAAAPEGLLMLRGITQEQWNNAMEDRAAKMAQKEREYFGSVFVFASVYEIAAQMLTLAQLPESFDRKTFMDMLMYSYSLVFGYSPDEFWPVNFGALGRGEESGVQHRKSTAKGGQDYTKLFQESFQKLLPDTLLYEFDERDVTGETEDALLRQEQVTWVKSLYEGNSQQAGLISRDEGRVLLAEMGVISPEWTEHEEDVVVDEEDHTADDEQEPVEPGSGEEPAMPEEKQLKWRELVKTEQVQRAAWSYPSEPIIQAHWKGPGQRVTIETIVSLGEKLLPRKIYSFPVKRAALPGDTLFEEGEVIITTGDVDKALEEGKKRTGEEFYRLLTAKKWEG